MKGQTRLIIEEKHQNVDLLENLANWLKDDNKWNHLQQNFSEELSVLMVAEKDYRQSQVISEKFITNFITEWVTLDRFSDKLRYQMLESIRIIAEIHTTVQKFFLKLPIDSSVFENAIRLYGKTFPGYSDSTIFWDTLIAYRSFFCRELVNNALDDELDTIKAHLMKQVNLQNVSLFNVSLAQGNLGLAKNLYSVAQTDKPTQDLMEIQLRLKNMELNLMPVSNKFDILEVTRMSLVKLTHQIESPLIKFEAMQIFGEIGRILLELPRNNHAIYKNYTGVAQPEQSKIYENSIKYMEQAIDIIEMQGENLEISNCYMKMADLAFQGMEKILDVNGIEIQKHVITFTLRALKYGNARAREIFPSLLQLSHLYEDELKETFRNEIKDIPEWLFLQWIPQIFSHMNLHSESFLDPLITKIALSYPNALVYHLKLTLSQHKSDTIRPFLHDLLKQIENPLIKKFIAALSLITLPCVKVLSSVYNLLSLINRTVTTKLKFDQAILLEIKKIFAGRDMHGTHYHRIYQYEQQLNDLRSLDGK